jgi:hypothetical protein
VTLRYTDPAPLPEGQRALLERFAQATDPVRITGASIRSAAKLVRRNYARQVGTLDDGAGGFYEITPTGAKEVASWSK